MTESQPFLKRWIKALRSGKYDQARGRLRTPDGYCCLGVACDLLKDEIPEAAEAIAVDGLGRSRKSHLPIQIADLLCNEGVNAMIGNVRFAGARNDPRWASDLNDSGHPFSEIADRLEQEFVRDVS